MNSLTRIGVGIALIGGAANSMLYNGKINDMLISTLRFSVLVHHVLLLTVDGGHRAVIFDRFQGIKQEVIGEGTHFMIPWLHRPIIFDIRTRPRSVAVSTGSKGIAPAAILFLQLNDYHLNQMYLFRFANG